MEATTPSSHWPRRVGIGLSTLLALFLLLSASGKLTGQQEVLDVFAALGIPATKATPIGVTELCCALLYAVPQTAVLGAVLLTGYFGGAVMAHVRIGEPFITPVVIGVIAWGALYLRDARLRALLPLRR
jgi:hypothetical protein